MKVKLQNVRIAYPDLHEPRLPPDPKPGEVAKFGANFIFAPDHPALKLIETAMLTVGKEKWKDNAVNIIKELEKGKKCLRRGDSNLDQSGAVRDGFAGMFYIAAKSKTRPLVLDANKSPLTAADGKPYGGCYVDAIIDVYAMDKPKMGKSINAQLKGVQYRGPGDAFGGASSASADEFDDIPVGADEESSLV